MSKMHNLGTVFKFETIRVLKKPTFWLMALGFPLMFAALYGIMFWSQSTTMQAAKELEKQEFSLAVTDDSKLVRPELLMAAKTKTVESKEAGINDVKNGKIDAYIYFPKDIGKQKVEVYGKDVGLFQNGKYGAVAQSLLSQSVASSVSQAQVAILQNKVQLSSTTYLDGKEHGGINEMIAPGLFLVIFFMLVTFFGNQMLTSSTEEKENRTVEMLLTMVKTDTLITGKILSLMVLALIQMLVIILPVAAGYLAFGSKLQLPNMDLSLLVFDPVRIGLALVIFLASFMMFTGMLVTLGAMMPTAKEASQWFGLVIMLIFGPFYGITAFVSFPDSPFVKFLSLFPFTAPIPLLLRNAVGNLPAWEGLLGVALLIVAAVFVLWLAVRIFRYGAMSYDSKLSLSALRMKRKADKV
ncbi:MAG: ABC transporter permease [Candidatus Saccharimonas sp.]|nr:MAG: ABC transporter permease [Candidatus Saccharimonas sp.]